jgi:phage terminase small subunit
MGGRPRKPTAALELAGAFDKNPKRGKEREHEPKPLGEIGKAPKSLDEDATAVWNDMAFEGHWLTSADRFLLEIAAKYMAYFSNGGSDTKTIGQLITVLNKLGFGPAERSKIKAPGGKEDDKPKGFDEFK